MRGHMSHAQSPEKGGSPTGEVLAYIIDYCAVTPCSFTRFQQTSVFSVNFIRSSMNRIIIILCNNWRMFLNLWDQNLVKINVKIL